MEHLQKQSKNKPGNGRRSIMKTQFVKVDHGKVTRGRKYSARLVNTPYMEWVAIHPDGKPGYVTTREKQEIEARENILIHATI